MLVLFVLTVAIGLIVGLSRGGTLTALANIRLQWPALAMVAAATQLALPALPVAWRPVLLTVSLLALAGWVVRSRTKRDAPSGMRVAMAMIGAGVAMNAVAILANGNMPVSRSALRQAGVPDTVNIASGHHFKHQYSDRATRLRWLTDVIPVRPVEGALSIGDIALLAGIAMLVASGTRPARRTTTRSRLPLWQATWASSWAERPMARKEPGRSSSSASEDSSGRPPVLSDSRTRRLPT
jgi:hypothetical protein